MKRSLIVLALLAAPAGAYAQRAPDTLRLDEIVVTATRLRTSIANAPGAVTVITGDVLQQQGIRFIADALRTVPGVALAQSAGPGSLTSVFMRGGESDYVQVLVDGVQVNDPGGAYNWAHLRTDDIDRIEIVRGPASVLYGSDAVAGVIQIFTRAGGSPKVQAGITAERGDRRGPDADGSFLTRGYDASLSGTASAPLLRATTLRYGFHAARSDSDGLYAFNSDYDNTNMSARIQLAAPRADAALTLRAGDNEYHYPTSGNGAVVDRNQFALTDTKSFGLDAGYRVDRAVELRLLGAHHAVDGRTENPEDQAGDGSFVSNTDQTRRTLDARANIELPRNTVLTLGIEREWQRARTDFESISSFGTFADTTDDERDNTGMYAQLHGTPLRALAVTIGARVDDNSAFGRFETGRIAVRWNPATAFRVHAAAGTAFKEPTFFENFASGFARGNPDLQPEEARSWEVGAEHAIHAGRFSLGATYFDQTFRNLIQFTFTTPTPNAPNYFNVGRARARGVEATGRGNVHGASIVANYTWTDTRTTDEGYGGDRSFVEGEPLLRRPRHQATAGLAYMVSTALRASLTARIVGERTDLDFTVPGDFTGRRTILSGYETLDAGIGYTLQRRDAGSVDLSVQVRNLFNRRYEEIYNFPVARRVLQIGVRAGMGL